MESVKGPACFHPFALPPFLATRVVLERSSVLRLRRVKFLSAKVLPLRVIPAKMSESTHTPNRKGDPSALPGDTYFGCGTPKEG